MVFKTNKEIAMSRKWTQEKLLSYFFLIFNNFQY